MYCGKKGTFLGQWADVEGTSVDVGRVGLAGDDVGEGGRKFRGTGRVRE